MAEMPTIWVIKVTYERNATDGIRYFTSKDRLAEAVAESEAVGGRVQVFKCVPVAHEVFSMKFAISIEGEE